MNICPKCGAKYDDNINVCATCGVVTVPENSMNFQNNSGTIPLPNQNTGKTQKKKKSPKKIAIIIGIILVLILGIAAFSGGDENDAQPVNKDNPIGKTVMIYVVGSDLESINGAATADFTEIAESGVDTEANDVLVCTGGSFLWQNDYVTAEENAIIRLNGESFEKIESNPVKNMGESDTLSDFITYSMKNFPNDQYVLLLWNHGGGPINGYGFDEVYEYDSLSMKEIQAALDKSGLGKDNKIELIGFDACLMGNIETAWCLKDYANFLVSSQETEPGFGWNYEFLENLQYYQNGQELGKVIIDDYISSYDGFEMTLSCFDLSKIENTEKTINDLFADVNTFITKDGFESLSKVRYKTKTFAKAGGDTEYDIVDLNHLVTLLEEHYPDKAKAVKDSIGELVCYSGSTVTNASGVSICHPYENADYIASIDSYVQLYQEFDFAENYTKYLLNFGLMANGVDADTIEKYSDLILKSNTKNTFNVKLSDEQMASLAGAQYVVYTKIPASESNTGKDEFFPVFCGEDITVDDNGVLYATYDTKAVFAVDKKTGDDSGIPIYLEYIYDGSGDFKYSTDAFFSRIDENENKLGYESVDVRWMLKKDGDKVYFAEAFVVPPEDKAEDFVSGKQTVNPDDYDTYNIVNPSYYAVADDEGNTILEKTGTGYGWVIDKDPGYELEYREIENLENYYIAFEFIDIYGNKSMTCLTPFAEQSSDSTPETTEKPVADNSDKMAGFDFQDGKIAFEGKVYDFPMKASDLIAAGWEYTADFKKLGANETGAVTFTKGIDYITTIVMNTSDKEIKLKDAIVIDFDYEFYKNSNGLAFAKGIKPGMSKADFLKVIEGYDFEIEEGDDVTYYKTPYTGEGYSYQFAVYESDGVQTLRITYEN